MSIFVWILIIILALTILLLTIALLRVIKKAAYFSDKEKDMIIFSIDMYVDYGEEIGITDEKQHPIIVDELTKIKKKIE
jgi:cell division protein FtsI/penicillin-binding protein 2